MTKQLTKWAIFKKLKRTKIMEVKVWSVTIELMCVETMKHEMAWLNDEEELKKMSEACETNEKICYIKTN